MTIAHRYWFFGFALVLLLALALAACGDGDGGGGANPPAPAAGAASPTPVRGESRTVISDDGKLALEIPPGALDEDVPITITSVPLEELPKALQEVRGAGDGYRLEPDGLRFLKPVAVSLELSRAELKDLPENGTNTYALVSLTEDGERELLREAVTEASLGKDTIVVRGELSHFSTVTRTQGSLTVTLDGIFDGINDEQQEVGKTFTARASGTNPIPSSNAAIASLGPLLGTFFAVGTPSVEGNPYFSRTALLIGDNPAGGFGTGLFMCNAPPGVGLYGFRVVTLSTVQGEDGEPIVSQLTVIVDDDVECVAALTPTPTPTPTSAASPAPTPAPTEDLSAASLSLGCDHRIPNVESDVIVKVSGLEPGQTVLGIVSGPGVISVSAFGEGGFSATANDSGVAEARVPINEFGTYDVEVAFLSGSIQVGNVCTPP